MTTIEQSLLEQALNALLLPCDRWNKQQFLIVKGAIESLNAALVAPATAPEFPADWAQMIHYPECWDTAAYPELRDAIHEALAWSGCSVCKPSTAPDLSAAYIGAREDLAIWKKRALEAEETARQLTRALAEEVNGPTFMGEPVLPATAPAQPEIVDLLAEMYELILANKVVLAEKSGGVWTWPDRAIEAVRKHRSGPARAQADHKKSV